LRHPKATIADIDGLPKVGETGRWVERLEALSDYAAACLAVFLQSNAEIFLCASLFSRALYFT
jgi:hypothetical protein